MCGIAGYIDTSNRQVERDVIDNMLVKLIHRGPDQKKSFTNRNVALGAARLNILDLSDGGNQPIQTTDGTGILCYNGEIYNHKDLRQELEKEGVTFNSRCDTETILQALHTWGPENAISRFNGMFAFAYYNLENRSAWLGRDRAGIKPLYIARSKNTIAFASEMKALFEHPDVGCKPDMHALTTYLIEKRLYQWTPFENITELPPGTLLKITDNSESEFIYFDLLRDLDIDRLLRAENKSTNECQSQLEALLPESVRSHLMSDVPLAVMCSGGIDSSLVAAYAKQFKPDLTAYVVEVDGAEVNEAKRAQQACNHLDIDLRIVPINRKNYLNLWAKAAYHHEEPIYFKQNMLHLAVAEAVHRDGFKILLCGEGADELFGGYRWQKRVYEMWKVRRQRSAFIPDNRVTRFLSRFIPKNHPLNLDQLAGEPFRYIGESPSPGNLNPREIATIDGGQRPLWRRAMMDKLKPLEKIEERAFLARSFEDFLVHLGTSLRCNDKMNMACSVESRVPFLDQRLIDFALHLPVHTKYRNGISKPLLKETASKHLPNDLIQQPKVGFGVSDQLWNNTIDVLDGGWLEEKLKWKKQFRQELKEHIRTRPLFQFHLVSTEIWAQLFFENKSVGNITEKLLEIDSQKSSKS